jgi:hypothetical protein
VVQVRADHYEALLDFLLEAVSDQGTTPFPAQVLAGVRRVVRCETVSYFEWSPQELLEFSLAANDRRRPCGSGPSLDRMVNRYLTSAGSLHLRAPQSR